jgi:HEAT repeat protein
MADGLIVSRATLMVSLLALAGASAAMATSWRAQRRVTSMPTAGGAVGDGEEVERRLAALERQVELLRVDLATRASAAALASVPGKGAPAAPAAATISSAAAAELGLRLARLEELAANIQASHGGTRTVIPEAIAAAASTVLDRRAPAQERAAALSLLRPNDGRSDGRTHEVVTAALEMIQAPETSPRLRAGMIRDLDRLGDPALKDPLMGILSGDADGRTRREAVETLAVFYDDPQVRGAVERLKDTDPEPQVRLQAVKQLGRWAARGQ